MNGFMYMYGDYASMLLLIPAIILSIYAQIKLKSAYGKYSEVRSRSGWVAADLARELMRREGINNVQVARIQGTMTDHYDPRANVVRLSDGVANSSSIAALGIMAHEIGHVMQHNEGYAPIRIRNSLVPVVNIATTLSWPLLLIGLVLSTPFLATIGVLLYTAAVAFQVITLPVELNASHRAMRALEAGNYLSAEELPGARKVLSAAAMTYVAALLTSIMQLLRMILIARSGRRRD